MPSAFTEDTRDGKQPCRTRRRLLTLSIGLATVGALLPATAFALRYEGPAHGRARPTSASTHVRLLSDPTAIEYGASGRASSVSRPNTLPGSAAPARASGLPAYKLTANSGYTALGVRANGYSELVILSSHGATNWVL